MFSLELSLLLSPSPRSFPTIYAKYDSLRQSSRTSCLPRCSGKQSVLCFRQPLATLLRSQATTERKARHFVSSIALSSVTSTLNQKNFFTLISNEISPFVNGLVVHLQMEKFVWNGKEIFPCASTKRRFLFWDVFIHKPEFMNEPPARMIAITRSVCGIFCFHTWKQNPHTRAQKRNRVPGNDRAAFK